MPLVAHVDAGGENYLALAKRKLKQWHAQMLESGDLSLAKVIQVTDGTVIYVNSVYLGQGQFRDRIRITSGAEGIVPADPFQPLWGIQSALMPGTRPGVDPALSWVPTVQHVTSFFPNKDGTYIRRHWLVICRYCRRVAEYTWDEAKYLSSLGDGTPAFATIGAYVTHAPDGSSVTLRDTSADGTQNTYTTAIDPSLTAVSDANPWGWIDQGPSNEHPGSPPSAPVLAFSGEIIYQAGSLPPDAGYVITSIFRSRYTLTTNVAGATISTIVSEGNNTDYNTNFPGADMVATMIASPGSVSGYNVFPFVSPRTGANLNATPTLVAFDGDRSASGPPHPILSSGGFDPEETYIFSSINAMNVYTQFPPWGGPAGSFTDGGGQWIPTGLKAAQAAYTATQSDWNARAIACAKYIVDQISTMMTQKLYTATEVAELRPYDGAIDHRNQRQALVIPAYSAASLSFLLGSQGDTYSYSSPVVLSLLPSSIYSVSMQLTTPNDPAPPDTPWAVTAGDPLVFDYSPENQTFAPAAAPTMPLKNAYFSKTTVPPLVLGQTVSLGYNGFYRVAGVTARTAQDIAFQPLSTGDLNSLMQRLCVSTISKAELAYIIYHALKSDTARSTRIAIPLLPSYIINEQAKAYRAVDHTQSAGAYSFLQPAIPTA